MSMISENMFLDVIADVDSAYVEEVLYMSEYTESNNDLQKYRKKNNFGKIFGSVAACLAVAGVGLTVLMLHNKGFFSTPYSSETTPAPISNTTVPDLTEETVQSSSTASTLPNYPEEDYQELVIALSAAIDHSDTYEELFDEIERIGADKMITRTEIYESSETYAEGIVMRQEELTGKIEYGTIFKMWFSTGENDWVEIGKLNLNDPELPQLPQNLVFEGIKGDIISREDMTGIEFFESKPDVWSNIRCEGFAYLAEPKGISYNSVDHKDMFDDANWFSGNVNVSDSDYEYKRYNVGDKICGLTVQIADLGFMNMSEENVTDKCRLGMSVGFDGTLTLTGYLASYTPENGSPIPGWIESVYFAPDAESSKKLPVFKGFNTPTESTLMTGHLTNDFGFYSEHCKIDLSNSDDFDDFDDFPDNQAVKVEITISDLSYAYSQGGAYSCWAYAVLQNVRVID